jgi:hypothetical protein
MERPRPGIFRRINGGEAPILPGAIDFSFPSLLFPFFLRKTSLVARKSAHGGPPGRAFTEIQ